MKQRKSPIQDEAETDSKTVDYETSGEGRRSSMRSKRSSGRGCNFTARSFQLRTEVPMKTGLEEAISSGCKLLIEELDKMNEDFILRGAISKMAIRDFAWTLAEKFNDHYELAEHLEYIADALRNATSENDSN